MRCEKYNIGNELPSYLEHDGHMVPCIPENFEKLGVLERVDAIPEEGQTITQSHGEEIDGQWVEIIDPHDREKIITSLHRQIENETKMELANGFSYEGNTFPLIGELYAQNMAAGSAYFIRGGDGGRGFYSIYGTFAGVSDVAGLIALGDDIATSISLSSVERKAGLELLTDEELLLILEDKSDL